MVNQVKISLPQNEFSALVKLALAELRDPESQARHLIREELERRGLLEPDILTENKSKKLIETSRCPEGGKS